MALMSPGWLWRKWVNVAGGLLATVLVFTGAANAIDFYEIQIYDTDTAPVDRLVLELHSNGIPATNSELAKSDMDLHQVHETVEGTFGVLPWAEIGQYFCTAVFPADGYQYAGSRSKFHFGIPQTFDWPVQFGGNIELDYMRRQAEENPLTLELRPIIGANYRDFRLVINLAFEKPFRGPQTHDGMQFDPSGEIIYHMNRWFVPAIEYYGDMGPIQPLPSLQAQQHFIVPAVNFDFMPQLELNFGVGVGLTRASDGVFIKSIVGWTF